ncbi:helix-turn-helix domain-containing protein [Streptomyces abikoensis]|uniref:Helix-turn-helix domain-containing protein n=1 Tax=Streptomyces abikoensis TaxID=97398 RepID=A0ABW7TGC0_9ACTN
MAVGSNTEHDDFMTPDEAAKDLGCGVRWLRDGANHRGFPHHRLGKAMQFSAQDRAEIRAMSRVPAQPSKLAAARRRKAASLRSAKAVA